MDKSDHDFSTFFALIMHFALLRTQWIGFTSHSYFILKENTHYCFANIGIRSVSADFKNGLYQYRPI